MLENISRRQKHAKFPSGYTDKPAISQPNQQLCMSILLKLVKSSSEVKFHQN